jgi:hypothetical protein
MFVPSLYKQGAIKKNMFSIFIDQNGSSKIQIGGYDLKKYANGDIKWYNIVSSGFWNFNFSDVTFGDWKLEPSVNVMMGDTGTSLNMLPDVDFFAIQNHFFADKDC